MTKLQKIIVGLVWVAFLYDFFVRWYYQKNMKRLQVELDRLYEEYKRNKETETPLDDGFI